MKLLYAPGACSLGIHAILAQIGKPFEIQAVNLKDGEQRSASYVALNPKSKVPTLVRDDGSVVTEFPAIAYYLVRSNPEAGLFPEGLEEQTRALEATDYIVSTIHMQGFSRIFRPSGFTTDPAQEEKVKAGGMEMVEKGLKLIDGQLGSKTFITGKLSFADFALFYVTFWYGKRMGKQLPANLARHWAAMEALPGVQKALKAEGLV
jgi:glutathione S-transferase